MGLQKAAECHYIKVIDAYVLEYYDTWSVLGSLCLPICSNLLCGLEVDLMTVFVANVMSFSGSLVARWMDRLGGWWAWCLG